MGKSLLETIENKVYWGIVGALLTIAFGAIGLYTYFHVPKPSILFEITNESNVLDVHKPLEDLTIYFENENIQKKNLNLRIITVQISNNGEVDILQSFYDQKIDWGFKINNGKIINDARIVSSNSDYLKTNLTPKIVNESIVHLQKLILEKGKFFSIEILVLHNKETLPDISYIGKIVGVEKVIPIKTWEQNQKSNFWEKFFFGGFLVNILRPIITFICLILLIIIIAITSDKIGDFKNSFKQKRRKKEIIELFGEEPKDTKIKIVTESYINNGLKEIESINRLLGDTETLTLEIKRFQLENEFKERFKQLKTKEEKETLNIRHDPFLTEREFVMVGHQRYWRRPHLHELIEEKIIDLNKDGELVVDSDFKKVLARLTKYCENKG